MKKHLISMSSIAFAIMLTGCAKNSVSGESFSDVNSDQIAFRASAGNTKANDNALAELKGGFNVIALDQAAAYLPGFAAPAADNVTYAFNTGVTPNAWEWKDAATKDQKLWPMQDASYPLTFLAAYPLSTTVTKDAPTVAAGVVNNLTPAAFAWNTYYNGAAVAFDASKVSVDELAALTKVTRRPVNGFADMNFKHIMSNMKFQIVVPVGHTAYIHSVKIANVNKSGRSYDYTTGLWSAETAYAAGDNTHFAHFIASAGQPIQAITSSASEVKGLKDGATTTFHTLKLMPQTTVQQWALGADQNPAAETFRFDAASWKSSLTNGVIDAAAITKWHTAATAAKGMMDSKGWKGARVEIIYCLVDQTAGVGHEKNIIGYKSGIDGAAADLMVRVGYILDLNTLNTNTGWEAGKRYTFSIPLGTAGATNGVLLDPDYKGSNGENTDKPVDNPKTDPGDKVTKGGVIQFNVNVIDWVDAPGVGLN